MDGYGFGKAIEGLIAAGIFLFCLVVALVVCLVLALCHAPLWTLAVPVLLAIAAALVINAKVL